MYMNRLIIKMTLMLNSHIFSCTTRSLSLIVLPMFPISIYAIMNAETEDPVGRLK